MTLTLMGTALGIFSHIYTCIFKHGFEKENDYACQLEKLIPDQFVSSFVISSIHLVTNCCYSHFLGQVTSGLKFHPDREHIVYPLGCAVVIESIRSKKQPDLLWGHTDYVTCIAISNKDGNLIASGQRTHMGFKVLHILFFLNKYRIFFFLKTFLVHVTDFCSESE